MKRINKNVLMTALKDTYLILHMVPLKDLPEDRKVLVRAGTRFQVLLLQEQEDPFKQEKPQYWVQFPEMINRQYRWYAQIGHWQVEELDRDT